MRQTPEKSAVCSPVIALAGNPNVGKSTVFNALTGLHQHTGNWPGKTVANARGPYTYRQTEYTLVDLPGTYSLMANSAEEEVARDFVCFSKPDAVVVVCDATCLERNLNLVLQVLEITGNVVVCINLLDEARKKQISIDLSRLSHHLGVPVIGTSARSGKGLEQLKKEVAAMTSQQRPPRPIPYPAQIEEALAILEPPLQELLPDTQSHRFIALRLLEGQSAFCSAPERLLGRALCECPKVEAALSQARAVLSEWDEQKQRDRIAAAIVLKAEELYLDTVYLGYKNFHLRDRKIDRWLTNKKTGIPVMILLLAVILWLTLIGANYPSQLLSDLLFGFQNTLTAWCMSQQVPAWLHGVLVLGMYRVTAWVVAVMLPPMAIFFPLFTLLEDLGYLPRIAFNLDGFFQKSKACGKQALTMCMGFGCNAVGVSGCRIIDSPRERLIAILTNNFVPCNGRFPTLIALISMFFIASVGGPGQSVLAALCLTAVILLGIGMTLLSSRLLSSTLLKGVPSSFTLELPPYRRPQIGKVIVRSVLDRTLFVLGRAVSVAAPAGILLWISANLVIGERSVLSHCTTFLDPLGRLLGMDGVILTAFLFGFPANEIVLPLILMAYTATGTLTELGSLFQVKEILVANGWTSLTALCTILFSLMHWPCSTTCLTIRKETGSAKWTLAAILLPTLAGMLICLFTAALARLLGMG